MSTVLTLIIGIVIGLLWEKLFHTVAILTVKMRETKENKIKELNEVQKEIKEGRRKFKWQK